MVVAVGDPFQIVDLVDLVADGGEVFGDGVEDGLAAAVGAVGEPVDGFGSDQRGEAGGLSCYLLADPVRSDSGQH